MQTATIATSVPIASDEVPVRRATNSDAVSAIG